MLRKTALCLIRRQPAWPHEAVETGLRAAGYEVSTLLAAGAPELVVTWNNYGREAQIAAQAKQLGARHIVMENGYLRTDLAGRRYYVVEEDGYSGLGWSLVKAPSADRLRERFGEHFIGWTEPMRGSAVLVCGQMGGAYSPLSMPLSWVDDVCRRALDTFPSREVWWRPHPVRRRLPTIRDERLKVVDEREPFNGLLRSGRVSLVVVWTSNAATDALRAGVPVVYEGPSIKMRAFAAHNYNAQKYGAPSLMNAAQRATIVDRSLLLDAFAQVAWDQWNLEELAAGEPWRHL